MVTDDEMVNYVITTADYNHHIGADYDIENDDDDDHLYALIMLLCHFLKLICVFCSIAFSCLWLPQLYR